MPGVFDQSPDAARIGDYLLLAALGEGGMGVVHLAQAPDGRRVALKVLRPEVVGDTEARERLEREIRSLRRISSPRIAEILDADSHGPRPFVVTRYVPGLSLYHHVAEEGVVTGPDLLHFADALAEGVQAVHAVGVLHRDIKPTNVVMEGRSPVLIDFGLARVADDARLTRTGWLLGTPGYLAPEILYGEEAGPAADVHAWAATVSYAATGRSPYGTGPAMAVMDRVRRGQFDLAGVPRSVRELVRDCLAPDPGERPAMAAIRTRLREVRAPQDLPPAPQPAPEQWTMPFAPAADQATASTHPVAAPTESVPVAIPPAIPGAESHPAPPTRILPAVAPAPAAAHSRTMQVLELVGLGVLAGSVIAYAPYAGAALVGLVLLALRTASVTRQRHGRRMWLRGRRRWYDVPATVLSTPGYAFLALGGALALIAFAMLAALATYSAGYLFGQPVRTSLVLAGAATIPCLWWGPGSGRVREVTRQLVLRNSRTALGAWFLVVMCSVGAAVLIGLLMGDGANWAPAVGAPWR